MTTTTAYRRHRRRRIAEGRWRPWGDLDQVRAHLRRLLGEGHTARNIALAAGLSNHTAARALEPGRRRIPADVADALLTADPAAAAGFVPALGGMRRLRALATLGWGSPRLAAATGLTINTLDKIRSGRYRLVQAATHRAVAEAYAELCMRTPPAGRGTSRTRARARAAGWSPPLAWGDNIDDPQARPVGMRRTEEPR